MSSLAATVSGFTRGLAGRLRAERGRPHERAQPTPVGRTLSLSLNTLSAVILILALNIVVVSQLESYFWQQSLYHQVRLTLAEGATPVSPFTTDGRLIAAGTPLAVMNAPSIGLSHGVVVEGSDAAQTMQGIGHMRDTVMPCQTGTSVLLARSGSYGGVNLGNRWSQLRVGDEFNVTMGQGACTYRVVDQRLAGQKAPVLPSGSGGSLILTTAAGMPFFPSGVLRVDAALVTTAFPADQPVPASNVALSENPMGIDSSHLFQLILLLEVVLIITAAAIWAWRKWGRIETWVVAVPALAAFALLSATNIDYLLPNLL